MARIHTPRIESLHPAFRVITLFLLIATLVVFAQGLVGSPRLATQTQPAPNNRNSSTTPLFLPVVTYDSGGIGPLAVAVSDVNGDGHPDIVVTNYCGKTCSGGIVAVLLGNGDGTFRAPVTYSTGGVNPWAVAIGDLNGDGIPDLAIANLCNTNNCNYGTIAVLLGNGDGTFRSPIVFNAGGYWNFSILIHDVNHDGIPDLIVGNYLQCVTCTEGAVSIFFGNGDGTFQAPVQYSSSGYEVYGLAIGDVNRDGIDDLVVSNNCASSSNCPGPGGLSVLLGNPDGTFQPAVTYSSGGYWGPDQVVIVDMNGDGIPDLVASNYCQSGSNCPGSGDVAVLIGNGDGTFQPPVSYWSGGYHVFLVGVGDINGDGIPDVVVDNECDTTACIHGTAGVLLGNGDGTLQAAQTYSSGGSTPYKLVVTDLNADGHLDVVMANSASATVGVLLNNFQNPTSTSLVSSINPSVYGQTVTFTAQVTSDHGTPTGTVQVLNASTVVGTGTLTNGSVSISISNLPAGADSITASYVGGSGFAPSKSSPMNQTVTLASTTTSLSSSLNPAATGQPITLTATVNSQDGGAVTGTVNFAAGSQTLGSSTLGGNQAPLTTTFTSPGTYAITAHYVGDSNNTRSTSSALSEKIIASTTTALTSSLNPSIYGRKVTFIAKVTSAGPVPPTGRVKFQWGGGFFTIGSAPVDGTGMATFSISVLNADPYDLTAVYSGDVSNLGSTSPILNQLVLATTSSASLSASPNPSVVGQTVTVKATITSPTVTPKGPVTFSAGKTVLGVVQLASGKASLAVSSLPAGSIVVNVTYQGNSNIKGSSASLTQLVQ